MTRERALLLQARSWFFPHESRQDSVSIFAEPGEVLRWMEAVDALEKLWTTTNSTEGSSEASPPT